ncbi:THUMP domain-containing class I SAM-dependent RNA methyltransferase [Litoreibacter janthinus]|uniref:Putative N6-adenine-specific DNA methylase n=1 Tax=Litoreibacter janthinus TaxID=670154 RepID=A0A1I6GXI3_9RHOB|nr:RNA methyltransferase [Litoreibacter janthinus]SFR46973.1 putative N6-adenine-specific DNA methylase [Litoreibacter janthinus]
MTDTSLEIFAVAPPGLEVALLPEFRALGYKDARYGPGGVTLHGGWSDVWRLNLELRGATKVLARIGSFRAMSLAGLDHRAEEFPWTDTLYSGTTVRVEATCKRSKIYHAGAAIERIERALRKAGMEPSAEGDVTLKVRIEQNIVTLSVDTSGESLHKREHKEAIGKAPLRENLAALFLRQAGYTGTEPVLDPMCGSGTFVIEAAEIAEGLQAGRSRSFAFEHLASFDEMDYKALRRAVSVMKGPARFYGSDRDAGTIKGAKANADRAGISALCDFQCMPVSELQRPEGHAGLVIVNPPYGGRIGDKKQLFALYGTLGKTLKERFAGWRVALVTSEPGLAKATGLPLTQGPAVPHGGLKVWLFQTPPLK